MKMIVRTILILIMMIANCISGSNNIMMKIIMVIIPLITLMITVIIVH